MFVVTEFGHEDRMEDRILVLTEDFEIAKSARAKSGNLARIFEVEVER